MTNEIDNDDNDDGDDMMSHFGFSFPPDFGFINIFTRQFPHTTCHNPFSVCAC